MELSMFKMIITAYAMYLFIVVLGYTLTQKMRDRY